METPVCVVASDEIDQQSDEYSTVIANVRFIPDKKHTR